MLENTLCNIVRLDMEQVAGHRKEGRMAGQQFTEFKQGLDWFGSAILFGIFRKFYLCAFSFQILVLFKPESCLKTGFLLVV